MTEYRQNHVVVSIELGSSTHRLWLVSTGGAKEPRALPGRHTVNESHRPPSALITNGAPYGGLVESWFIRILSLGAVLEGNIGLPPILGS